MNESGANKGTVDLGGFRLQTEVTSTSSIGDRDHWRARLPERRGDRVRAPEISTYWAPGKYQGPDLRV